MFQKIILMFFLGSRKSTASPGTCWKSSTALVWRLPKTSRPWWRSWWRPRRLPRLQQGSLEEQQQWKALMVRIKCQIKTNWGNSSSGSFTITILQWVFHLDNDLHVTYMENDMVWDDHCCRYIRNCRHDKYDKNHRNCSHKGVIVLKSLSKRPTLHILVQFIDSWLFYKWEKKGPDHLGHRLGDLGRFLGSRCHREL